MLLYHCLEELNPMKFLKKRGHRKLRKHNVYAEKGSGVYVTLENGGYKAKLQWKKEVCNLPLNEIIALERKFNVITFE